MIIQLLLIIITFLPNLDPNPKATIDWRERRKLNWSDFKGNPDLSSPNAALTSTSILISYGYDKTSFTYQLKCVFHPEKSWTKVKNDLILAHEQGHFDITQIFTRKLNKELMGYKYDPANVEKDIQSIYQRIHQEQDAFQRTYDRETNFSRNAVKQEEWILKMEKELVELEQYANYPNQ